MRDAKRCGLAGLPRGRRQKGGTVADPYGGQTWFAGWLVDRHGKGRDGLSADAARASLKKFPGYEEVADDRFPPDE
jgi:hypothetical protein